MLNVAHKKTHWPKWLKITLLVSSAVCLLAGLDLLNGWAVEYVRQALLMLRVLPAGDLAHMPNYSPLFISQSIDLTSYALVRSIAEGLAVLIILGAIVVTLRQGWNRHTLLVSAAFALVAALLIYVFTFTQISSALSRPADSPVQWNPTDEEHSNAGPPRGGALAMVPAGLHEESRSPWVE